MLTYCEVFDFSKNIQSMPKPHDTNQTIYESKSHSKPTFIPFSSIQLGLQGDFTTLHMLTVFGHSHFGSNLGERHIHDEVVPRADSNEVDNHQHEENYAEGQKA